MDKKKAHPLQRKVAIVGTGLLVSLAILLPFLMGTSVYPITIVNGNSMYPTLQNGDLVFFKGVGSGPISNGSIIVYVQSLAGSTLLDQLTKPVLIHRIIGVTTQNGTVVYYTTKGDNNLLPDPYAVNPSNVLGVPVLIVPKVGLLVMFFTSPQGLVALVALITLFYLDKVEKSDQDSKRKDAFLGKIAQMALNDEIPESVFKKFELATKYADAVEMGELRSSMVLAMVDWLKKGGLEQGWNAKKTPCPTCGGPSTTFETPDNLLLAVCPHCLSNGR